MTIQWKIEFTDEFGSWWETLSNVEQESVRASVKLLGEIDPGLRFPHMSGIVGSRHSHLRELRVQHAGRPYRVLFAFDPRRCAILLLGGDKTGIDRGYDENVPIADRLYDAHLELHRKERLTDG